MPGSVFDFSSAASRRRGTDLDAKRHRTVRAPRDVGAGLLEPVPELVAHSLVDGRGESGPIAFLSGSNSPARSVSTIAERSAKGKASKMNCSNLTALGSAGLMLCPLSSMKPTFLMARWKGRDYADQRSMNDRSRIWTAMLPAHSSSDPSARGDRPARGKVGVLDHLGPTVDHHHHASFSSGELARRLERQLGVRFSVQADERWSAIRTRGYPLK